jgi:hypothetical protein
MDTTTYLARHELEARHAAAVAEGNHWRPLVRKVLPQVYADARRTTDPAAATRVCCGCRQSLPLDRFGIDNSRFLGRNYYCKPCHRAKNRRSFLRRKGERRDRHA